MPSVRMPDGTIIENVPEGTTQSELRRRLGQVQQSQTPQLMAQRGQPRQQQTSTPLPESEPSFAEAFGRGGLSRVLDSILSIPEAVSTAGGQATEPLIDTPDARRSSEGFMQMPSGLEVMAGAESGVERAGSVLTQGRDPQTMPQRMQANLQQAEQTAEQAPVATQLGETAGDIGMLLAGRAPFSRVINSMERQLVPRAQMFFGNAAPQVLKPGLRRMVKWTLDKPSVRKLFRGAGRSAETGLEGAMLESLKEGDPLEVAGIAAGGQASGSLMLSALKGTFSGGPVRIGGKLALEAAAIGSMIQIMKSATPGGKDFSLESLESGFNKVTLGIALGAMSGMLGAGRLGRGGELAEDFPKMIDALASVPRGAALSTLTEWRDSDPGDAQTIETVLQQVQEDPEVFGKSAQRRLERALSNESVSIKSTVDSLMENREFRQTLDNLVSSDSER